MICEFALSTGKQGLYNITSNIRKIISDSEVIDGICVVYCPHTTAGITVNENADPDVVTDFLLGMDKAFPDRREFRHAEGNSSAHLKASSVGASQTFVIRNGEPLLGVWQGIYFCEFDGPRTRRYYVKVL